MHFFLTLFVSVILAFSHSSEAAFTNVEQAINNSDAAKVVSYGKDKILLQIQGKEGVYAQAQATQLLRDFFTRKPVSSFRFTFKSKATEDAPLTTGTYNSKGESFRITIKWKRQNTDIRIESISIE